MRELSVKSSFVTGCSLSSSVVNMGAQNSFSFYDMPLPSLTTSLVSSSFGPTDSLAGFLVLTLLKAYIIFMSLEKCFFAVLVGLHYGMTCALLGFQCSSVSLFWIPFPGFEEYVIEP